MKIRGEGKDETRRIVGFQNKTLSSASYAALGRGFTQASKSTKVSRKVVILLVVVTACTTPFVALHNDTAVN